ncbi:hypothetical protein LTR78_008803 [Recurvomyces mirabilis]|uniref:SH3 domain-containing protein n=1 Tax=Recurvomyces mirabilis TaxID=574656 RepID=A0AAE0TPG8_9PEZI|nr:hypothetical protein LTR78_008803 [Recurvomyces mirabilis]KAK5160959.1 hypothetical protein LTS14_000753 [Recurvomyces mirabilis]
MNVCRYVCSTCHLRQRFQAHILSLQQARRGFSVSRTVQDQQQHSHGNGQRRQFQYGQPEAANGQPIRGRYSRQPLQPDQLLQQLSTPQSKDKYQIQSLPGPALPPELHDLLRRFLDVRKSDRSPLDASWPLLQQLAASPDARLLSKRRDFVPPYKHLIIHMSRKTITGPTAQENVVNGEGRGFLRPSDIIALHDRFGIDLGETWAKVLWRISKNLLGMRARGLPEKSQRLNLDELVTIWNLALRARLQRHRGETTSSGSNGKLDWTFLPPIHIFTEMLHRSRRGSAKLFLEDGLQMLLPEVKDQRTFELAAKSEPDEVYDYTSAAIITLDALRMASAQLRDSSEADTVSEMYGQFIEVLETVFRVLPSAMPPAVAHFLDAGADGAKKNDMRRVLRGVGVDTGEVDLLKAEEQLASTPAASSANTSDSVRVAGREKVVDDIKSEPIVAQEKAEEAHMTPMLEGQRAVVLYAHEAGDAGEISVQGGQHVVLIEDDDGSGWINVRIEVSGDDLAIQGFIPANYIQTDDPRAYDALSAELDSTSLDGETSSEPSRPSAEEASTIAQSAPQTAQTQPQDVASRRSVSPVDADEIADRFVNLRINRLGQAMQKHSLTLADSIKREVLDFDSRASSPALRDQIYEHLLRALLALHNPTAALEVWKHFTQTLGRSPTVKTYTVMMQGAQHVRDVQGVERFWSEMGKAEVRPDVNAWTTRIFGLIRGGWVAEGMGAVEEMGRRWLIAAAEEKQRMDGRSVGGQGGRRGRHQAQQPAALSLAEATMLFPSDINGVPRPSQIAMNAAISALATRDDKQIPSVLAWGRSFGIKPDQTTYNALLNICMRHGRFEEAEGILTRMREEGIETSGDTWTVLLTLVFERGQLEDLSKEEVREKVMTLITSLEEGSGQPLDSKSYALVIDRLLKRHDNTEAANTVLAHMLSMNLTPSPHIYTILMTSYLSPTQFSTSADFNDEAQFQRPPDFEAASALWQHIQSANGGRGAPVDAIFYDRVIEAYATYSRSPGSTKELTYFLNHMRSRGLRPGWRALELASRALAESGEWGRVMDLVDLARRGAGSGGEGGFLVGQRNFGARGFWEFVVGTGLLREEGVSSVEQVMMGKSGMGGPLGRERERRRRVGR